jgi:hypothetical protein
MIEGQIRHNLSGLTRRNRTRKGLILQFGSLLSLKLNLGLI